MYNLNSINNNCYSEMKKLKVCWLCILNSKELDDLIGISSNEYVLPSIPIMLDQLRNSSDVEIHVIAGNRYRNETESISNNNVTFHLYKRFDLENSDLINPLLDPKNIKFRNDQILDILNQIDPDIVHVHGACFLEFSPSVGEIIRRYPVFLSITGLIRHASQECALNKIVTWFESQVLKKAKFFGAITDEIKSVVTTLNKNAIFFDFQYQVFQPTVIKNNHGSESIDGIYFARLARDKGIFDFLTAVQLIAAQKPDSKFIIYGHGNAEKVKEVLDFAKSLNISNVIDFRGTSRTCRKFIKQLLMSKSAFYQPIMI